MPPFLKLYTEVTSWGLWFLKEFEEAQTVAPELKAIFGLSALILIVFIVLMAVTAS